MEKFVLIEWTEYERGWGQRPDGYSIYLDTVSAQKHIDSFYSKRIGSTTVPDEYTNPTDVNYVIVNDDGLREMMRLANEESRVCWLSNSDAYKLQQSDGMILCKEKPEVKI